MPFTPFHFGPGLLLKAAAPRQVSFLAFAVTQVLIDLESLYNLVQGAWPVHRELHTIGLATVAGLAAGTCTWLAARTLADRRLTVRPVLRAEGALAPALVGGAAGGSTHSLLDGLMHSDIQPFQPFSRTNPLLGLVGQEALHLVCALAGILGLFWIAVHYRRQQAGTW